MEGEDDEIRDKTPFSSTEDKLSLVSEQSKVYYVKGAENPSLQVSSILRKLVRSMSSSQDSETKYYVRLVKTLRLLKRSEVESIHQSFFKSNHKDFTPEEHKMIKDMLIDGWADACTKDSVSHLVSKIKRGEVDPSKASLTMKSRMNCRVVSRDMIEKMMVSVVNDGIFMSRKNEPKRASEPCRESCL